MPKNDDKKRKDEIFRDKLLKIIELFRNSPTILNYVHFFDEVDITKKEFDSWKRDTTSENERLVERLETLEYARILDSAMNGDSPNAPIMKAYIESKHDLGAKEDYEKTTQSMINELAKQLGYKKSRGSIKSGDKQHDKVFTDG